MKKRSIVKKTAWSLLFTLGYQLIYPTVSLALTSGPSQPEVQSFEPVGTTDMVDLFSGDFVYNIPLLDVDGYPINISYHSGITVEQEASWVGLGWNINPGVVNRAVRGMPDDFNGDTIERVVHIKPEKNVKVAAGGNVEFFGGGFNISAGIFVNSNNYRGLSAGYNTGLGVSAFGFASAGVNMGISSQGGGDIDYNASLSYTTSQTMSRDFAAGVGINAGSGYNTRNGVKDITVTVSANYKNDFKQKKTTGAELFGSTIPISLQNYVPVITNTSQHHGFGASIGIGGEVFGVYPHGYLGLTMSRLSYDPDGTKRGYGYMHLQNATDEDIMDFTRDKDGSFNETMQYLPAGNTTYDVYAVSGQGNGGIFRPFRNDHGIVFDPKLKSYNENETWGGEVGLGNLVEVGLNRQVFKTTMECGPWTDAKRKYINKRKNGSIFENVYFKQAGELTVVPQQYFSQIQGTSPIDLRPTTMGTIPVSKTGGRDARGSLFYFLSNEEASRVDESSKQFSYSTRYIQNYTDTSNGLKYGPNVTRSNVNRLDNKTRRKHQIAEVINVAKDGSRYVYGLPAMNNIQKEVSFSVDGSGADLQRGTTSFTSTEDGTGNTSGIDNYYSMTVTPSYAHSYLLTNILSTDYVDVSNDGPSDDDLGTYVKFNYGRREADYRWRVPYQSDSASYSPGFYCDTKDDKANYIIGSKELWYVHSIETKNMVAEFYVSTREDAKGATGDILPSTSQYGGGNYAGEPYNGSTSSASSYKLDSIKLYNKHDRFLNQDNAVPVKTIFFEYDYSLCPGTPNSEAINKGKLTLKKIFMSYGKSEKNLLSPYQFTYHNPDPEVPYDIALKDRWGNYKPNDSLRPNFEFPYVDQTDPASNDENARMWHLTQIALPSGGTLSVNYESDDYAYVQDRRAMEMFKVDGVGISPYFVANGSSLYLDKNAPYTYLYFTRRKTQEFSTNLKQVYLNNQNTIYFNFAVDIASKGSFEAVRGYADVEAIGACSDSTHGWVRIKTKIPDGSNARISPIVYTGLNMARYNLSHLFYPGSDPEVSDLENIVKGMAAAGKELVFLFTNPIDRFVREGKAKNYNHERSFIRLHHPNLTKKGGGSRVKEIKINDSWDYMTNDQSSSSDYGNTYDYTIKDGTFGTISSGVASYEPLIGGDENPFRQPAGYYKAVKGSKFPPNDPIELFQEDPLGESFFPPASVGYSCVRVHSIHKEKARSAQTEDEYEFYTAKNYPIQLLATQINADPGKPTKNFFNSTIEFSATQGYSIIVNDMHGKPKSIKNYAFRKGDDGKIRKEMVTGQTYIYNAGGNALNNNVKTFSSSGGNVIESTCDLGQEIDITIDSRQKLERTRITNIWTNLNSFMMGYFFIPIPTAFFPSHNQNRAFKSLVCTKMVQQYGILKGVETIKDGAKTFVENMVYDPYTGQALLTKVNNEYRDAEYQMNYPAYWAYDLMGPAYRNICVEDKVRLVFNYGNHLKARTILTSAPSSYQVGDELMVRTISANTFTLDTAIANKYYKAWVVAGGGTSMPVIVCSGNSIPMTTGSEIDTVVAEVKILRSGSRNMLTSSIQATNSLDNPVQASKLSFAPQKVINTKVTTYSDTLVPLYPWHTSGLHVDNQVNNSDTNVYMFGYRGLFRPANEYVYFADRDYTQGHSRKDGTYPINIKARFWDGSSGKLKENSLANVSTLYTYWKLAKSATVFNAWGNELENKDALNIPSTAQYGFNNTHPVAVAQNAKYYEVLSEGFEDYRQLKLNPYKYTASSNLLLFGFSPFNTLFPLVNPSILSPSTIYKYHNTAGLTGSGLELSTAASHTGYYSLKVNSTAQVNVKTAPSVNLNVFSLQKSKKYILNYWAKPVSGSGIPNGISVTQLNASNSQIALTTSSSRAITNSIDGWVLYEAYVEVHATATTVRVNLNSGSYYDDLRIFPSDANMKSFVYHHMNQKLIASLDENNFATFYEYDPEGQLVRINKETERGILTVQESRRANMKR
jgi:hypothetical protein